MMVGAKLKPVAVKISDRVVLREEKGKRKKGVSDEKQVWKEDRRRRKESEEARGIENGNRGVLVGRRVSVY